MQKSSFSYSGIALCVAAISITILIAGASFAGEHPGEQKTEAPKEKWVGIYGAIGTQYHIFSANDYDGHKENAWAAFWEVESRPWIPLPVEAQRTLRFELRYAEIHGTIEIVREQVPSEDWNGGPPYYTTLDHYQVALLGIRRWVFLPHYFIRPSLHLGLGISWLNKNILEDGTQYNFNLIGGTGLEMDFSDRWCGFLDVRWEHFSNGGKMGLTDKDVIGLESINAVLGIRYAYGSDF